MGRNGDGDGGEGAYKCRLDATTTTPTGTRTCYGNSTATAGRYHAAERRFGVIAIRRANKSDSAHASSALGESQFMLHAPDSSVTGSRQLLTAVIRSAYHGNYLFCHVRSHSNHQGDRGACREEAEAWQAQAKAASSAGTVSRGRIPRYRYKTTLSRGTRNCLVLSA